MQDNEIFVFGSNEAGIHGAGAAKVAKQRFGAIQGRGVGLQGNSYAIPTKDTNLNILPIESIKKYISVFLLMARYSSPELRFYVTRIGCGLAGYKDKDIAPLFQEASANCIFDIAWKPFLGEGYQYFEGEL